MLYDVVIIGGGVIGCAIARELSRYQVRVMLVEKECEVGFGTSKSNSGIIHAGHHAPRNTLKGSLVVEGSRAFTQLAQELNFGYKQIGEIVVAKTEDEIPHLEQLLDRGKRKGVEGLEIWSQTRLLQEEPNLSPTLVAGLYAPTAGVINPYEYCFNLIENACQNGCELLPESPVFNIDVADDCFRVKTPNRIVNTRFVINAAGLFSDKIAQLVGLSDFTIRPRKGEEYMLDKRMRGVVRRLIFPVPSPLTKGTLIIPTFDGTLMIGPTAKDVDSKEDLSTTDGGAEDVFKSAQSLVPSIHPRDTIAEFAGLRAVSNTNDFIIGPTSVRGFINVAGIQSPGLTAAPAIGRLVCEILVDEGCQLVEKSDFDPLVEPIIRFSALSASEKADQIATDKRFSSLVCRCEEVTEGEVLDAIERGARTLDGLKFRIRAGMGRCQGGFCTWRLMEMLAEHLECPIHQITKRGGDSWLVTPRQDDGDAATKEGRS